MRRHTKGDSSLDIDLVHIGLRIIAVRADRNPVTAAYAAVPLVENALRAFITHVHNTAPQAVAFDSVSDAEIAQWWIRGTFKRPRTSERLTTASLAVLAAVLSCRGNLPLFHDAIEVSQIVDMLDQRRNFLGHNIETPDRTFSRELADCAERILELASRSGNIEFSLKTLARSVTPPHGVLTNA